ncbi:hypothetical protein DSO57_1000748 [Entomophthora muscae]|uniref:Uncharacterized protein n=1 Tax=Entomophthora muscae TaxID=34485 RepID=A0ACC2T9W8_9FUNG|nr:hypothetical protein DSO57_1000748 [Entomophthora muscae]
MPNIMKSNASLILGFIHLTRYVALVSDRTVLEILGEELYYTKKAEVEIALSLEAKEESPAEAEKRITERLAAHAQEYHAAVFENTERESNFRWRFEEQIKRTYFHVKPLDTWQLQNWEQYLTFEEAKGSDRRIEALYERCLVPCAYYQELWIRYAQWLVFKDKLQEAEAVFKRATLSFIPSKYTAIRLDYALLLEALGKPEEARTMYQKQLDSAPDHLETLYRLLHFERRLNPERFKRALVEHINSTILSSTSKAFLSSQLANHVWKEEKDTEGAAKIFEDYLAIFPDSEFLWTEYVYFCTTNGACSEDVVSQLLKSKMKSSFITKSLTTYQSYFIEHATDPTALAKLQSLVFRTKTNLFEASLKRSPELDLSRDATSPKHHVSDPSGITLPKPKPAIKAPPLPRRVYQPKISQQAPKKPNNLFAHFPPGVVDLSAHLKLISSPLGPCLLPIIGLNPTTHGPSLHAIHQSLTMGLLELYLIINGLQLSIIQDNGSRLHILAKKGASIVTLPDSIVTPLGVLVLQEIIVAINNATINPLINQNT